MQRIPFRERKVWNQVFNTLQNTSVFHQTLKPMQLPIDAGRNQIFINKTESKTLKARAEKVGKILKYQCLNDLKVRSGIEGKQNPKQSLSKMFLTALETQAPMINPSTGTLDWIPNQLLHSNTDPNNGSSWTSDQFIGLVATNPGTTYVRVITGSHHLKDDHYRKRKYIHVIALQQYEYFVVKPTLIHGGSTNKPYKDDDPSCDDGSAAANIMPRRSMKGTVPLSTIKLSSVEQCNDVKQYRNTRLHFYYNIPAAATNQTYFLVDSQAAHLQIMDCTATDMFNVRLGKKHKKRTIVRMASADEAICKRRRRA